MTYDLSPALPTEPHDAADQEIADDRHESAHKRFADWTGGKPDAAIAQHFLEQSFYDNELSLPVYLAATQSSDARVRAEAERWAEKVLVEMEEGGL